MSKYREIIRFISQRISQSDISESLRVSSEYSDDNYPFRVWFQGIRGQVPVIPEAFQNVKDKENGLSKYKKFARQTHVIHMARCESI